MNRVATMMTLVLLASACTVETDDGESEGERAAGPHQEEFGLVTFWHVTNSTSELTSCTDSTEWSDAVTAPAFGDNSYLMYKVVDSTSALSQSCSELDASSCSDDGDIWNISGNVLTFVDEPTTLVGDSACDFALQPTWTVTDSGTTALFNIDMVFSADETKSDCAALDQSIKVASSNGHGLLDCNISIDVDMEFTMVE